MIKDSPRKKKLNSDSTERNSLIGDALKLLNKIPKNQKKEVKNEIESFITTFQNYYRKNFNSSVERGEDIKDSLNCIAHKARDLSSQINGLSIQTRQKLAFSLTRKSGWWAPYDLFEPEGTNFRNSNLWQILNELESSAIDVAERAKYPIDDCGYMLVCWCFTIFKGHSDSRITKEGKFKEFIDCIWYAIFKEVNKKGSSGAIRKFWELNPSLIGKQIGKKT